MPQRNLTVCQRFVTAFLPADYGITYSRVMPAVALPRLIEEKFDDLSRQVRRLWLYRGLGRVIVAAIAAALAAIVLDRAIGFNSATRWAVTLGWLAVIAWAVWRF